MLDDDEEYLKREYGQHEYQKKIRMLSEYYIFHKDFPKIYGLPIEITMNRYFENRRDYDYKKVRKMLKQQNKIDFQESQGSMDSNSMINHSSFIKKSRYSTMLGALQKSNDANETDLLLSTICKLEAIVKRKRIPDTKLIMNKDMSDYLSTERNKFVNWMRKNENQERPKLHLRKGIFKNQNEAYDFKKKRSQFKSKEKILAPTKKQEQAKGCVHNTHINISIKNALIYDARSNKVPISLESLRRHSINSKQIYDSIKPATSRPLIRNLDIIQSVDSTSELKRVKRQKSIQKIYGVRMRSASLGGSTETQTSTTRKSARTDKKSVHQTSKPIKTCQSLRQFKSAQYQKPRSPSHQNRRGSSPQIQTTGKKQKFDFGMPNYTAMSKELKNFDSIYSSSKNETKQNLQRLLEKKIQLGCSTQRSKNLS